MKLDGSNIRFEESVLDTGAIPKVILGQNYKGFLVTEDNRATVWETEAGGVSDLYNYMYRNYIHKGVRAVLLGVHHDGILEYAVFTEPGFLTHVSDTEY